MNDTPKASAPRPWLRRTGLAVMACWLAIAAFPGVPAPALPGLDGSWVLGLSMAHAQGLVHGRDIVWTYGPLGYLSLPTPFSGQMYGTLFHLIGLYLLWAVTLVRLALSNKNQAAWWSTLVVGIVAVLDPMMSSDHLELAAFTIAILTIVDDGFRRIADLFLLAFLAALGLMVKINFGIQIGAMFLCLAVSTFIFERRNRKMRNWVIATAASLPVLVFCLYFASTGTLSLPAYLRHGLDISSGYSDSMSSQGPIAFVGVALLSLVLLFGAIPALTKSFPDVKAAFFPALVSAFFVFKATMVRQDAGHVAPFEARLALISLFFLVTAKTPAFRRALMGFQVACLITGYFLVSNVWPQTGRLMVTRLTLQVGTLVRGFLFWPDTWQSEIRESQKLLAADKLGPDFHAAVGSGAVDAIPWETAQVPANGWRWNPRPVFQSYAAYTPALDRINAEHYESGHAADFLIVSWSLIDGRHPFFENPLSWRSLLNRYRSGLSDGSVLLMGRAGEPRFDGTETFHSGVARWNEEIPAPQDVAPLLLSAGMHKSAYGALRSLVYQLSPVWIDVKRRSGKTDRYRMVAANAGSGMILNPLPRDLADLNIVGRSGCLLRDPVVSLTFRTPGEREFESPIPVSWSRLRTLPPPGTAESCVVADAPRRDFPAWGGAGWVLVTAGEGAPWTLQSGVDWIRPAGAEPTMAAFALSFNHGPAERNGDISIGNTGITIRQSGVSQETVPKIVQLGLFQPGYQGGTEAPSASGSFQLLRDRWSTFGLPGDQPVMGDWTGNGTLRIGIFRNGWWYLDLNGNGRWDGVEGGDGLYAFGLPDDQAVVGDWTGDGVTKLGVFRGGTWFLDLKNEHRYVPSNPVFHYGIAGDIPVVGKWRAGSKIDQIGVYRKGEWYVDSNGDRAFQPTDDRYRFGLDGDFPVVSRSRSRLGVYRKGIWILDTNGSRGFEPSDAFIVYGSPKDRPLIGEW
jgi:hypothetical protein